MRQKRAHQLRRENPSAPHPGRKGGGMIGRNEVRRVRHDEHDREPDAPSFSDRLAERLQRIIWRRQR